MPQTRKAAARRAVPTFTWPARRAGPTTASIVSPVSTVSGQGPTLTWPARPGENYRVQFKESLDQAVWQNVVGTVTLNGDQASLTDLAPSSAQRFYRVKAF